MQRISLLLHNFGGPLGVLVFGALWAVCLSGLLALSYIRPSTVRIPLSLVVLVSTALGFGYEYSTRSPLDYDALEVMWDARSHASDAFGFYGNRFINVALTLLLGLGAMALPPATTSPISLPSSLKRTFTLVGLAALPYVAILALAIVRAGDGTDGLPVQYKTVSLGTMLAMSHAFAPRLTREPVNLSLEKRERPPHIVLVVDESVRGDFLNDTSLVPSAGIRPRETANFGLAVSATNCSVGSNLVLRTGAVSSDPAGSLGRGPFIWQFARAAGYRTTYLEAQEKRGIYNNRMKPSEAAYIDNFVWIEGHSRIDKDLEAAHQVRELVTSPSPQFIYVLKAGLHFPYESSYNEADAVFAPHMTGGYVVPSRERMVNSYKNALLLSIDKFFREFLQNLDLTNTVVIYTSDHGQSLFDNGTELTHCSANGSSPLEGVVPLIVFTERADWQSRIQEALSINKDRLTHYNIFPTILELMGYSAPQLRARYDSTIFEPQTAPRRFVSGSLGEYRFAIGQRAAPRFTAVPAVIAGRLPGAIEVH